MRLLCFGDVFGKLGRRAVAAALPELVQRYQPDVVTANVENLAHGAGLTEKTWNELHQAGVMIGTGGNHSLEKPDGNELLANPDLPLVRPANYAMTDTPGVGLKIIDTPAGQIAVINLLGELFMNHDTRPVTNPFLKLDELLAQPDLPAVKLLDFHAEASSEKVAMGFYADGRVSAVIGSHTHVATADQRVLPNGTAFVSDVGIVGGLNSIIGAEAEPILEAYQAGQSKGKLVLPETGESIVNAVLISINDQTGLAEMIERVDTQTEV